MNSKLKSLIVCGVFVLCLAVVAVVLLAQAKDDEKKPSDNDSSQGTNDVLTQKETPLFNYDKTQVKSIIVENEFGKLSFIQNKTGGDKWTIEEIKDIEQNSTLTTAAANIAASVSYLDVVEENASDLSKYGLTEPKSTFTVSYADVDQTVKTFLIGNESPKDGYFYLCEKGQTKVYTANEKGLRYYMNKPEYFADLTLLENPDNTDNWPSITDLTVKRTDLDYVVKFKTVGEESSIVSSEIMYEPITMPLNVTNSVNLTHGLWGLKAEQAIVAYPDEKDFAEYGLDKPTTVVTLEIGTGESYTLSIGKPIYYLDESGNQTSNVAGYYAYIEGVEKTDVIFSVPVDSLPWATFKPEDAISTLMTSNYIYDVDSILIKDKNETYEIDLMGEGENAPSEVTVNGEKVDVDLFRTFYQYVITCPTNQIYWKETVKDPYITVEINTKDGKTDKLEFVKDTERRTIVFLNDRPQFLIARTWTDLLSENITNLINGDEIKSHV
ncbi:MAG: DUF4340 domain-containing protein [Ruminococcus sp.]|nr:DUF4340 domain-containing protein [Ruminococcus sp.]